MQGHRENVVKLEAGHSTVCKFGSDQNIQDSLKLVKADIKDLYRKALKRSKSFACFMSVGTRQRFDKDQDVEDTQLWERLEALQPVRKSVSQRGFLTLSELSYIE